MGDDFFDDPAYRLTKLVLRSVGQWPYQKLYTRLIITGALYCDSVVTMIALVWYIVDNINDTAEVVMCLPTLLMPVIMLTAVINGTIKSNKLKSTLDLVKETRIDVKDAEEVKIFKKYGKFGQLFASIMFGLGFLPVTFFSVLPLISARLESSISPNQSKPMDNILKLNFYNLDPQEYYIPIYIFCVQISFFVVFGVMMYDIYFIVVINHVCGMFKILGYKISRVGQLNEELRNELSHRELDDRLSKEINICINYHWKCVRFSDLIEDSLTYLWLVILFISASQITVMAVQTVVYLDKPLYMISFAMNATALVFLMFFINWSSQQLLNCSDQLGKFIYDIEWYEFPSHSKKLLLTMLLRSTRPCKLTAGKIIELNLMTFGTFMKMSASYFTMVFSTQ